MKRQPMARRLTRDERVELYCRTGLREVELTPPSKESIRNMVKAALSMVAVLALVFVPGPLP